MNNFYPEIIIDGEISYSILMYDSFIFYGTIIFYNILLSLLKKNVRRVGLWVVRRILRDHRPSFESLTLNLTNSRS